MWTLTGFADEIAPDLAVQVRVLSQLSIGFLELRGVWGVNVLDLDEEQLARVASTLAAAGIGVSAVGSPIGKVPVTGDFAAHLGRFDRALAVADRLGAPFIRLFSFYIPEGADPARYRDEVVARLAALARRAAGHDVVLLHENERGIYGDVPGRCLDIVESVGAENLRLVFDAANFVLCGVRPFTDAYPLLRPYTAYLHIKDAVAATGRIVPAGEGDGQVAETVAALAGDGFSGFCSLEPHLAHGGPAGGFSGPELFATAAGAFTGILDTAGIAYG